MEDPETMTIEDMLKLVVAIGTAVPPPRGPAALDGLFEELRQPRPRRPPHEIENEIWAAWSRHRDPAMTRRLEQATRAIANADYVRARVLLDPLIDDFPDWAEAWNKRATVFYLQGRDTESFADIRRALALEPRHFGAICGFAQICLRRGERTAALTAFEVALGIHPHLYGVHGVVEDLLETMDMKASLH
jgi:tetratricopeptide (TPR) repeat protein